MIPCSQIEVPLSEPFLVYFTCHPGFHVVLVMETMFCGCFVIKCLWLLELPNDERGQFL